LAVSWYILVYVAGGIIHLGAIVAVLLAEGRKPTATLAWVLAITFLPFIGIALYLTIGSTKSRQVVRSSKKAAAALEALRSRVREQSPKSKGLVLEPRTRSMLNLGERLATLPGTVGNQASMLVNASAAYRVMIEAVEEAEHHLHLEFYIVEPDEVGQSFRDRLVRRARQGIEVRVLVDAVGSSRLPREFWRNLEGAGGQVGVFNPIVSPLSRVRKRDRVDFRNHRKILVVDGRRGFTGGINIGREYLGLDPEQGHWRDTHVDIEGPAVWSLQSAFATDWYTTKGELVDGPAYFPVALHGNGGALVQIVDSGPDREISSIAHFFAESIGMAEKRVWLTTPYFVPSSHIDQSLMGAALKGVDVKLLLPSKGDSALVTHAARSYYKPLLEAGVRIFEYQAGFPHAKTMLVDDWAGTIGSANMDMRSFLLNFEINAFVFEDGFVSEMARQFRDDLRKAREIDLDAVGRRSLGTRLLQSSARLLSPLL
jgi:cardiolipin synthase